MKTQEQQVNFLVHIFSRRITKKISIKVFILMILLIITTFYTCHHYFYKTPRRSDGILFVKSAHQKNSSTTTRTSTISSTSPLHGNITYYELVNDTRYHYQFRFEYNSSSVNDDPRLIILLNGNVRTCADYWNFAVGRRILNALHSFRFFILVICSKKRTFDREEPVQNNTDVRWIYSSLQKWMNDVFYKQFQRYPRLYIHGISKGSQIASLLCRILPIQQQIFTISLAHSHGLFTPSDYPIELQRRLQLDSVFANWFYFDFCYKLASNNNNNITKLCPFQSERYHYQPVPPIYFIHLQNDRLLDRSFFTALVKALRQDSFIVGGKLLNNTEGVKLYTLSPANATSTYMQETYDTWRSKPHASAIFYEHYVNRSRYNATNSTRQTCQCLPTDFRYYELYPNITRLWSKQKQDEYKDYTNDINRYKHFFCEDVCGDLYTDHAMSSRHLDKALEWMGRIDSLRHSLFVQDYLARPLRIWMYNKTSIMSNDTYFSSREPDFTNVSESYQMYSPEYYLQDYFQQLRRSNSISRHNLQWAANPLLADYFIIPSDLSYHLSYADLNNMYVAEYTKLFDKLNTVYFEPLLTNIRNTFPYWSMAKQRDQMGSNHILTVLNGRNMGLLYNHTQKLLKNVIQIAFTGFRQDMLPANAPVRTDRRGKPLIYRHGYDVVIPPFRRIMPNKNSSRNVSMLMQKKKRLLFFAGAMDHVTTAESARALLAKLKLNLTQSHKLNMTIDMRGKRYDALLLIDGHLKPDEYMDSVQSSVFNLCPEGFYLWSPRFYDAMQLGAIPLILADSIVLPFERFIDWVSFSAKVNVSNIGKLIDLVQQIENLEEYMKQKLTNAQKYKDALKWPYSTVSENRHKKHVFLPEEDRNGSAANVLHYIYLELRCRRLEQMYGLTSDSFSRKSIDAQRQACTAYPTVCPCHNVKRSVAFRQFF